MKLYKQAQDHQDRDREFIEYQNPLRLELEAYRYRFYQIVPVSRS